MKARSLVGLCVALLVPIALGTTYAVGTHGDTGQPGIEMAQAQARAAAMATVTKQVAATLRLARARCQHLIGADRANCKTEARVEARRTLRKARESAPPSPA